MKGFKIGALSLVMFAGSVTAVSAAYIADFTYDYIDNGGGNFTFDVTVKNNSTGGDIGALDYFEIYFDADADWSTYSNITWTDDQSWMYVEAADPDPGFGGLPGIVLADDYDYILGTTGGITQGNDLTFGFSFDYSGTVSLTSQTFSWFASFTDDNDSIVGDQIGNLVYSSNNNPPNEVPEPASFLLFGAGIAGLLAARKRKVRK